MLHTPKVPAPEIAVVIPTYRRTVGVLRLLASLEQQTLAPDRFEVIVVDDCSGDGTVDALEQWAQNTPLRARILATPRNVGGAASPRNVGWRATTAPIVAFVDDDCVVDSRWAEAGLERLAAKPSIGVAQGRTVRPEGAVLHDWTVWREIVELSPYFEACNIFYRRDAIAATGGFAEDLRMGGEDTDVGWAVVDAGWESAFVDDAVVVHDVVERGVSWRIRYGFQERRNLMTVAARHPSFRRAAFWRPWAFQRDDVLSTLAFVGVALGLRWRPALVLVVPYVRYRRPPPGHARPFPFACERLAVDMAQAAGVAVGAVTNRLVVV